MATNPKRSNTAVNAAAVAVTTLANSGYLRIYDGTQPATADIAITASEHILAELRWNATAFGAPVAGVATANAITSDPSADRTGTATWFRSYQSDGTTVLWDGSVGTSAADLILVTTSIVALAIVDCSAFVYNENKG